MGLEGGVGVGVFRAVVDDRACMYTRSFTTTYPRLDLLLVVGFDEPSIVACSVVVYYSTHISIVISYSKSIKYSKYSNHISMEVQ